MNQFIAIGSLNSTVEKHEQDMQGSDSIIYMAPNLFGISASFPPVQAAVAPVR